LSAALSIPVASVLVSPCACLYIPVPDLSLPTQRAWRNSPPVGGSLDPGKSALDREKSRFPPTCRRCRKMESGRSPTRTRVLAFQVQMRTRRTPEPGGTRRPRSRRADAPNGGDTHEISEIDHARRIQCGGAPRTWPAAG
jgi:hypothetical protein